MYHSQEKVKFEFMGRWSYKKWNKKDDRDDVAFWDQRKVVKYLEENPPHLGIFAYVLDGEERRRVW